MQKYIDILAYRQKCTALDSAVFFAISLIALVMAVVFAYLAFRKSPKTKVTKSKKIYKITQSAANRVMKRFMIFLLCTSTALTCILAFFGCYHLRLYKDIRYDIDNKSFCTVTGSYTKNDRGRAWTSTTVTDSDGNKIHLTNGYRNTFTIEDEPPVTFVYSEKSKILVRWYKEEE